MEDTAESILSMLGFSVDLVVNLPAFDFPVPSAMLAASGLVIVLFAAFNDILKGFSTFGANASIVIAICMAVLSYVFFLKNEATVVLICTFFCLMMRVCEAAAVGRSLASPLRFVVLGLAGALLTAFALLPRSPWPLDKSHLLVLWNLGQALLAARSAAAIQAKYGTLKSKEVLALGFFLMLVAASLQIPDNPELRQFYLWSYPGVLILSFVVNWRNKPNRSAEATT
jgi:hypothetical protein